MMSGSYNVLLRKLRLLGDGDVKEAVWVWSSL